MVPWNLSLILSNTQQVHVSTMSILRTLYPEKYGNSNNNESNEVNYYEKHRPYAMYHADTIRKILIKFWACKVRLCNGSNTGKWK